MFGIIINFITERSDSIHLEKINEGAWTKEKLNNYIADLSIGFAENGMEDLGDAGAFDIASDALSYEDGLKEAIEKFEGVQDPVGWLANQIA